MDQIVLSFLKIIIQVYLIFKTTGWKEVENAAS